MLYLKVASLFICAIILLTTTDVIQCKYVYEAEAQRWIGQNKIVATWQEAKHICDRAGAILASPISEQLLNDMKSYIAVNGHSNAYFIGMKLRSEPELQYVSVEGVQLDELPEAVLDMIEKLDPRDGDCLSMNRDSINVVQCWERLPYICYTDMTTNGTNAKKPKTERMAIAVDTSTPVQDTSTETDKITEMTETSDVTDTTPTNRAPDCNHEGYKYYQETGHCYRIDYFGSNWDIANRICYAEGGYLVILNDENEAKVVKEILKTALVHSNGSPMGWVGLHDKTGKGDWRSIQGHSMDKIYNKWYYSYHFNSNSNLCGTLLMDGSLHYLRCRYETIYICEKDAIL